MSIKAFSNIQFMGSFAKLEQCPQTTIPEIAFIGRSNVGKSSLINTITQKKGLAKTSTTPGKTQLMVYFNVNDQFHLVDLPGYGYAKVSKSSRQTFKGMIFDFIETRTQLWCLYILLDIRHEPMKIDKDFILKCGEMGIPFQIVFTKSDKVTTNEKAATLAAYKRFLSEHWEELPPIWVTTALYANGAEELAHSIVESVGTK